MKPKWILISLAAKTAQLYSLTLVVWMNTRSIHSKFNKDGNVVTKSHPLHHMQRKEVWGGFSFGSRIETTAQLCGAPLSGLNQ